MDEKALSEIREKLKEVNALIKPYQLDYVDPATDCILLAKNAHYMEKEKFENLVKNVAEDQFLSQIPFGVKKPDGKYLVVSGNHRVKSAIKANLPYILILFIENISREKEIAYQLSHNALVGKDDLAILKEIFDELETIQGKEFSGLNEVVFPEFSIKSFPSINEKDIELQEMRFFFTNARAEQVDQVLSKLQELKVDEKSARLVNIPFMEFLKVLTEFKRKVNISSNTVAFIKLIEIVKEYTDGQKDEV